MRDDSAYLQHMLDAIAWIESYVQGLSEDQFKQNHLQQKPKE